MQAYRPDRVVRTLTALVSIAYYALGAGAIAALVALPVAKLFAAGNPDWTWGLKVPAMVRDSEATVLTGWGTARLVVEGVRGDLLLPITTLPWWLVAVLWTYAAVLFVLLLLPLYHLRRIFQRVRDGAPFDAQNALRMRWLGLLLLALALYIGVTEAVTSLLVKQGLAGSNVTVKTGFHIDVPIVFVGLVLVALAEIFRRGAELEDEQSLVI